MAVASGLTVANLYYAQPLLSSLSSVFHVSTATAGTLITLTQVGYVLGRLIPTNFPMLLAASLISGAASVVAQILVPFAAYLAPDHARGRIVGRVMSGLFPGILLSRALSSLVYDVVGRRAVFLGSAALTAVLIVVLPVSLPPARADHVPSVPPGVAFHGPTGTHPPRPDAPRPLPGRDVRRVQSLPDHSLLRTERPALPLLTGRGRHLRLVGAAGAAVAPLAGRCADGGLVRP
ncbi:hypothetical protein GCM10023080_074030 [Streptomyces pseudoechinosporeus]